MIKRQKIEKNKCKNDEERMTKGVQRKTKKKFNT